MADETQAVPARIRSRYRSMSPFVVLSATTAAALIGGLLLWLATERSFPALGLLGVVVATLAAWVTTDYTATHWRHQDIPHWRSFVRVAAGAGAVAVVIAEWRRWPWLAFLGLMALTLWIGPLVGQARSAAAAKAERWMQIGLAAGFVSSVAIALPFLGAFRLVAIVGLLFGFAMFTGGLSTMCARGAEPKSFVLRIIPGDARQRGLIVGAIGLALLLAGLALRWPPVISVGAWLTVVAMVILSVVPARFEISTLMKRSILVAGAGLVIVAGYQLFATGTFGRSVTFALFIVATVALAGAWIVWRGATLFIGVLLGFIFVWGLFPYTTSDPDHVSTVASDGDAATAGVVAFGDSFISGEGAPTFYDRTDQKGTHQNECRRAPTAYPVLISLTADGGEADQEGADPVDGLTAPGLDFLACSGAKVDQVLRLEIDNPSDDEENRAGAKEGMELALDEGDMSTVESLEQIAEADGDSADDDDAEQCPDGDVRSEGQYGCGPDDVYGKELQLTHLAAERSATQLVLVSIGGNDVRFGDIVSGCLLPGTCAERREVWLDNVPAIGPKLTATYQELRDAFGGNVPVVVMPYPLVLTEESCADSPLESSEHEFIYEFTTVLNRQIAISAAEAGVHFFGPGAFALEGNRLCESTDRAINLIRLQPTDGPVWSRMSPKAWPHNSMHPNRLGHRMIADHLRAWLEAEEIVGSGNPDAVAATAGPLLDVRSARPFAVSPSVVQELTSSGVLSDVDALADCGFEQIESFATRIAVFDEQTEGGADDESAQAFLVPVEGTDTTTRVCVTDSLGNWTAPDRVQVEPGESRVRRLPWSEPGVEVVGDRVFVSGGRPDGRCAEVSRDDEVNEDLCAFQWILFSSPVDDDSTAMVERTWNLRAVQYCTTDPECEDSFSDWSTAQIRQAGREVGAPLGLIFLGGWLFALGVELLRTPSVGLRREELDGADPAVATS